ncbi:HD domain-containing protein [Pusillibacter faecalis]|uniref:HD domain-containing protein n=1 Tax=Pusillibacter faecalis TaxID=2714358 RepID=UPI001BD17B49|nr:HD domain-containing protein [Pusillibacter faecalis]MCQ5027310.1 HD domain-containing protein [Oscillibacter valericigenes]
MTVLTYEDVKDNAAIRTYIQRADESLTALGFTEHSFAHVTAVAEKAGYILETLGYPARTVELVKIAGFLHDIGNLVNRVDHSQSGAVMAFRLLDNLQCDPEEIATIVTAIGNHDEGTGLPVNAVSAALILADKSDVRRSRVRNQDPSTFDIHDRVNYSVKKSQLKINEEHTLIKLKLSVDTKYGSVMDYFEIFMQRMILCRKAAEKLGLQFKLMINEQQLI